VECEAEDVILPVLELLFVVAEPVCLADPEEPLDEPPFVLEAVFVFEAEFVFVADGICVCVAEDAVYRRSVCRR
jgi:hypothetical protein